MGHNRAGVKARLKLKRRRREEARLAAKAAAPAEQTSGAGKVVQKVKELAEGAVKKVGAAMEAAAHKIKDAVR